MPSKKPTKKKSFSINNFREKIGIPNVPDKPTEWIPLSPALHEQTGIVGIPNGYVTTFRGFSNTGKSTALYEAAVSAQKMGKLPIFLDLESNVSSSRFELMGLDQSDEANFIKVTKKELIELYAMKDNRDSASIEDAAEFIKEILARQRDGEIPFDIMFLMDSIGTLDSARVIHAKQDGKGVDYRWNGGAYSSAFGEILDRLIPLSKRQDSEFTNSLVGVQQIRKIISSMGTTEVENKGGDTFFYGTRLMFHMGNKMNHGARKVSAVSKGISIEFGKEARIAVEKNQIDGDTGGVSKEGKIISTPHGYISTDKASIDEYKKANLKYFREKLDIPSLTVEDIDFKYENISETVTEEDIENLEKDLQKINGEKIDPSTGEVIV